MNEPKPGALALPETISVKGGLKLCLLQANDAPAIWHILQADPSIAKRINWVANAQNVKDIERQIVLFNEVGELRYGIYQGENLVGYIGIWPSEEHAGDYELGYFLDSESRGRGYVSLSCIALMRVVTGTLSPKTYSLFIADDNQASQAVAKKLGFESSAEMFDNKVLKDLERRYIKVVDNE